ncbi:MAG: L-lactate dehydrogenase [Clostridiales bacterium]|nr:L-lactate dehydrogenase [Candidatus Scatonaster coprocaballi]
MEKEMKVKHGSKVAIIGAGAVGSSIAFAMAIQQLCTELVLIDVNKDKAKGEALDISHGLPFLGQMDIYAGDYSDVKDCDLIIITAGIPRKPGETRLDLAKKNVGLAKKITESIMEHYTTGNILVVSNPVDVLTYMIAKWSGLPRNRVLGSGTVLDSARFRILISQKLDIDVRNVHGYIIGEHGDSQLPAWSATNIAGLSIDDYSKTTGISFTQADRIEIAEKTRMAGAEVIGLKGATFDGIAVSVSTIAKSLLKGENTIRTVGSVLSGEYGIQDVATNVPTIIGADGIEKVLELDLDPQELRFLQASAESVKKILDEVRDL